MGTQHDVMQEMAAKAQLDFVTKALSNPADLEKHDFEEIRDSIDEIVTIARTELHLPMSKIATHLVALRTFAAFCDVEIDLPTNLTKQAEVNFAYGHKVKPTNHLSEAEAFGILAHSPVAREKL